MSMTSRQNLQTLLHLWPELPALIGPAWKDLFPQMRDLLLRIECCEDPEERGWLVFDLLETPLDRSQPLRERFRQIAEKIGADRGSPWESGTLPADWGELKAAIEHRLHPPLVTRYTDVTAPRRLAQGKVGAITFGLTVSPSPESLDTRALKLGIGSPVEVCCHAASEDFEILGAPVRRLTVEEGADTEPIAFKVRGLAPGLRPVRLDVRQSGVLVDALSVQIEVVPGEVASEEQQAIRGSFESGGPYAPPPDVELRVVCERLDPPVLRYMLHAPGGTGGFYYKDAGTVTLRLPMREYQEDLIARLERLMDGKDREPQVVLLKEDINDRLDSMGQALYDELFPPELKMLYRKLRREGDLSLVVASDEPWIPWEMIKPYEDEDDEVDEDFLCLQYRMTRWIAGSYAPPGEIPVSRLACVVADDLPVREGGQERRERLCLSRLVAEHPGIEDRSPGEVSLESVKALLDAGGIDLWHFASHGDTDPGHAGEAALYFSPYEALKAIDLRGERRTRLRENRSLVFLNACRAGVQGWSLTRLEGWASVWVEKCRCGSFLGPLWAVGTDMAGLMAETFYQELARRSTIGEAARTARRMVRDSLPGNLTWLAYSVYAHPNARIVLPPRAAGEVSSAPGTRESARPPSRP